MKRILKAHIRASICIFACISMALSFTFGWNYRFVYVNGDSMSSTINNGQWVIIQKRKSLGKSWTPSPYDVVVAYESDKKSELLVKRVIGLPGDTIQIKEGYIHINEKRLDDMYGHGRVLYYLVNEQGEQLHYWNKPSQPAVEYETHAAEIVPNDFIWVIGDNREDSYYGFIPSCNVVGIVIW